MELTELFWEIDDFCQDWLATFSSTFFPTNGNRLPKHCRLSLSEVMTICIHFHQSSYRTFKDYYIKQVCENLSDYFPRLVSYNRMVELMPNVLAACWAGHPPSTVNDQLKNISYLVHSRHRSLRNFMLNLITALIAYTHRWAGHPPSNLKNRG